MRPALVVLGLLTASVALAQQTEGQKQTQAQKPATPVYSVVEPKAPAKAKPAARKRAAKANAKGKPAAMARADALKANGPCVIKPVMSDQDLVNCGATPPRY